MSTVIRVLTLLATATLGLAATAQNAPNSTAAKPAAKANAQAAMPMPTPSPEMTQMVKAMSGTWTTTETMEKSPMMPNGGTGRGTSKMWPGPGGLSLLQNYHSSGAMGSFSGVGTSWWDPQAHVYKGVWCDSMSPCNDGGTSKWDGEKLVGTMEGDMNGQKMVTRITYSDFKPNSFVMTMDSGPDANALQKMMTITYTRVAAKTAEGGAEKKE